MFSVRRSLVGLGCILCVGYNVRAMQESLSDEYKGLRCEYPGKMEAWVCEETYAKMENFVKLGSRDIYDANSITMQKNGGVCAEIRRNSYSTCYRLELNTMQWIWVPVDVQSIKIILKPQKMVEGYIYFYNIFSKPLFFDLPFIVDKQLSNYLKGFPSIAVFDDEKQPIAKRYQLDPNCRIQLPLKVFKYKALELTMLT